MNRNEYLFRVLGSVGLWLAAAAGLAASAPAEPAAAAPAKPYNLFMGAEVSIAQGGDFHRVRAVQGDAFIIAVNGRPVSVPMGNGPINLKIDPILKLTEGSAVVAELTGDRAYTPQNDPRRKFLRQHPGTAGGATLGRAVGTYNIAQTSMAAARMGGDAGGIAAAQSQINSAAAGIDQAGLAAQSDFNSVGYFAGRMQAELDKKLFDAIEVTFSVSSPRPLSEPYVVLITTFRPPDAKPGIVQNWIYAQQLGRVDEVPQRVRILQGGFPPGFELKSYSLHLYNRGAELATNVASKRVPLTRDEALQYVLIEYLSANKGASLPPTLTLSRIPPELQARAAAGQLADTCYVKVTKEGKPGELFADPACTRPLDDAELARVVRELRFKPALLNGKPVPGVATLALRSAPSS
jgi:hypothetical protein